MISTQARVCFVGNCQASSLAKVAREKGIDAHYLLMCSTKVVDNGIDTARNYLARFSHKVLSKELLAYGFVRINPSHKDFARINPDVFVYTLFHERNKHYIHKEDNFLIEIADHLFGTLFYKNSDFILSKNDYSTYLERYRQMIIKNAVLFPDAEHIILQRINDIQFSYKSYPCLVQWNTLQYSSESFYNSLNEYNNINILKTEDALNRCIDTYGKKNIFYWKIKKIVNNKNYHFYKYLDTEHPIEEYWKGVIDLLFHTTTSLNKENNRDMINTHALLQSIEAGDIHTFIKNIRQLPSDNFDFYIPFLEAGVFLLKEHKEYRGEIKEALEETFDAVANSGVPHQQARMSGLLSLCSGDGALAGIEKDCPVAFWGAGGRAEIILEAFQEQLNVVCLFDSDEKKHGTTLAGIPVVAPHSDEIEQFSFHTILVTTIFFKEALSQIEQHPLLQQCSTINSNDILNQAILLRQTPCLLLPYDASKPAF